MPVLSLKVASPGQHIQSAAEGTLFFTGHGPAKSPTQPNWVLFGALGSL